MKNKRILYGSIFCGLLGIEVCIALFVNDSFIRPYVGDTPQSMCLAQQPSFYYPYYRAHYLSAQHPDFDSFYNERMVKHIASSSDEVLDYFTDSFEIRDNVRYKDGSNRVHTFLFPYISQLLDLLIVTKSSFAETALKKAIKYNAKTYKRLRELILSVKNDERYSAEYMKDLWIKVCKEDFDFFDDGSIVMFRAIYSRTNVDGIITNVAHVTKTPSSPVLKHLVDELNESYLSIKNLKENIGNIELWQNGVLTTIPVSTNT